MAAILVKLKCLTNMHVGNGEVNYNIIDNEVERDPVTQHPTVNASGIKGALRAHFRNQSEDILLNWFGSDYNEKKNHRQGKLKFMSAQMLARPLRATGGDRPYYMVYSEDSLEYYKTLCDAFGIPNGIKAKSETRNDIEAEGYSLSNPIKIGSDGTTLYKMDDEQLLSCSLPVVARNHLEDGRSTNLWYEEIVPHETIFYFFVTADDSDKTILDQFQKALEDARIIQIGGNASIGYGLCQISMEQKKKGNSK